MIAGNDPLGDGETFSVRSYTSVDATKVSWLAREGLLPGHVDHSAKATANDPHGSAAGHPAPESFWVVEVDGEMIGTIAMLEEGDSTGRLLQLRVAPKWKSDARVPRMLVRAVVECARRRNYMKVTIEEPGLEAHAPEDELSPIVQHMRELGFEYSRTTRGTGRTVLEFYLNLYEGPTH